MKIILINPPNIVDLSFGSLRQFKNIDIGNYLPLGLLYIAASIEHSSKHKVEIIDAQAEKLDFDSLRIILERSLPDVVGVYTMSFTLFDSYKTAKIAKTVSKDIITILGGPHLAVYPDESASLPYIDYIVCGEGEETIVELLEAIEGRRSFISVGGIGYKENGKTILTHPRTAIKNLDNLPFPARHLLPPDRYYSIVGQKKISTTIMASRGCPSNCYFCYIPYRTFRMRSAENIVREIEICVDAGIEEFFFFDENFTVSSRRVIEICDAIIDKKLKIDFDIRSRIDTVNRTLLERLKEAGCKRIQFGVESGNEDVLKMMNKKITLKQVRDTFKLCHDAGIRTYADIIIGYPGEDIKQIWDTVDLIHEIDPDYVQVGITMHFPSTKIYIDAMASDQLEDIWREHAMNPQRDFKAPYASNRFTPEELENLQQKIIRGFYLRPQYIFKRLKGVSGLIELVRGCKAGFRLLLQTL